MSSPWTPCGEATASSQISPSSHHHIQEFGTSIGKIFRGLRKKPQSQHLFVPADPLPQISTEEQGPPVPERPPPPRLPINYRPVSDDHWNMFLSSESLCSTHRRISAPQLHAESNSECSSNRPSLNTTSDMQLLYVDTEGHGETAGSGMDYVTRLPSPVTLRVPTCEEQLVQEKAFERLAAIRSVIDEKNRILGIVNDDIEKLQLFMTQRLSEAKDSSACNDEYFEQELKELRCEVADFEASLEKLRRDSPEFVPPPVPSRAAAIRASRWSCLQCTFWNEPNVFRCEKCSIPSLRIDPWESQMCGCSVCSDAMSRLHSVDSDWGIT